MNIDNGACDRSPGCPAKRVCPKGAITPVPGGRYPGANGYSIDEDRCTGCGICTRVCAGGAIHLG
ncbi:MAG: 4Fe-4S binding protein [Coriobacteriia bacterium]|nr:4Fe-4S binding protein [Coriobacteriia bacterium]MBN2822033.1 4Fe-4S binding protein [Coriobacteriia bacterium]